MSAPPSSSRRRFQVYRQRARQRRYDEPVTDSLAPAGMRSRYDTTRHRSFLELLKACLAQLRGHRRMLLVAIAGAALATLLGLVPPYGTKIIFDNVLDAKPLSESAPAWLPLPHEPVPLLATITGAMVLFAVIAMVVGVWSRWQATRISKRAQVALRRRVFDHAVRLPLHRVYQLKSGGVASILREDAGAIGELTFAMLYNPSRAVVQLLGSLAILAVTDWRLLLGSLVLLPVVWATHRTWIARIRPLWRDVRATRQMTDAHATEAFGGIRIVRGFSRQRAEARRFLGNNHLLIRQELLSWWWSRGIDMAWTMIIPTAAAGVLLYGGLRILSDNQAVAQGLLTSRQAFTKGDLVMFLTYLTWLLGPLALLANSATEFQRGLAGLDRVLDLLEEPTELPTRPGARVVSPETAAGRITLEHVSFAYPGSEQPVLSDVCMDVLPGQMVGLVGPSGAGKTTLCNIIARFHEPTAGLIRLDGADLRDVRTDSYRRLLGIVEQDIFLFDGTVAQNIAYGRRGAALADIRHAATLANAHGFVSALPQGYDTWVGERGVRLSGGQRQRIAIARAILANPRILIFDEATSNLDTESERLIQQSLATLMAGRTSFVIAHRLSTIAHADRIVVMEAGRVVEQGRHEELIQRLGGRYREMVELQIRPAKAATTNTTESRTDEENGMPTPSVQP